MHFVSDVGPAVPWSMKSTAGRPPTAVAPRRGGHLLVGLRHRDPRVSTAQSGDKMYQRSRSPVTTAGLGGLDTPGPKTTEVALRLSRRRRWQ